MKKLFDQLMAFFCHRVMYILPIPTIILLRGIDMSEFRPYTFWNLIRFHFAALKETWFIWVPTFLMVAYASYDLEILALIENLQTYGSFTPINPSFLPPLPDGFAFKAEIFKECVNATISDNLTDAKAHVAIHECLVKSGI